LVDLFPVSNNPDLGNGTAQFTASYSDPGTLDAYGIRIDHTFSSKLTMFGRYSDTPSRVSTRNGYGAMSSYGPQIQHMRTATLGLTALITPHITNEIRANYSNSRAGSVFVTDNFGGANPPSLSSLFQTLSYPAGLSPQNAEFALRLTSASAQVWSGDNAINEQRQVNFVDTVSLVTGAHQIKTGVDYRRLDPIAGPRNYLQMIFFSGVLGGAGTMQSGLAQMVSIVAPQPSFALVKNFSFFAQDTWKASPRFTLTYGLRWDVNPAFTSKDPTHPFYTVLGADNPATMTLAPVGTPMYATTWGNVAPRLGVAYRLRQQVGWDTVLRAGFGEFYDIGDSYLAGSYAMGWPFTSSRNFSNVAVPLTPDQAAPAPISTSYPIQGNMSVADPNLKLARTWETNVAVEQSLGAGQTLSMTYVGAIGRDEIYSYSMSGPNANFPLSVSVDTNKGTSDYHALQTKFQSRLSHNVQALAQYTWSHSIDTGSSSLVGNPPTVAPTANIDRGDSDFDIRHSFSGAVIYDVPSPAPRWAQAIFGGWSMNTLFTARTAPPVNLSAASVVAAGYSYSPRPNVVPGQPLYLYGAQYPGGMIYNKAAFVSPPTGQQGDLGRNVLRGFGAWQINYSVRRQFRVTERLKLEFSAEFFNILNHPNFGQPTSSITSALFGQSTAPLATSMQGGMAGVNPLYQFGGPRSIQFVGRITF
jgi:hypothetical protein